jgi:hypothetical protein
MDKTVVMSPTSLELLETVLLKAQNTPVFWELLGTVGPRDGGCLVVACALQKAFGGELVGIHKKRGYNEPMQHILVELPVEEGLIYADGGRVFYGQEAVLLWWDTHYNASNRYNSELSPVGPWALCKAQDYLGWNDINEKLEGGEIVEGLAKLYVDVFRGIETIC